MNKDDAGSDPKILYVSPSQDAMDDELSAEVHITDDLSAILDAMPFALMLVDEDHHIVHANGQVAAMVGKKAKDLLGCFCPQAIHGTTEPVPYCPLEESLASGQACEKQVHLPDVGLWIETGAYPTLFESEAGRRVYLHTVRDITEKKQAEHSLTRETRSRLVLHDLLRMVVSGRPLEAILADALDRLFQVPWIGLEEKGAIFVRQEDGVFRCAVQRNLAAPLLATCRELTLGRCLCGRAALSGEVVFASSVDERHDVTYDGMQPHGHYCVPLVSEAEVMGVLNLYVPAGYQRRHDEEAFLQSVADLLATFLAQRAAADDRQRALDEVEQTLLGTVRAIGRMLEARDAYTAGHQERVARVADLVATRLGWPDERRRPLRLAARLHDIGKIVVPVEVLAKPGRLSAPEFAMIKTHAEVGYSILADISFPWPIATIVRQHHEKLDGTGYPDGLAADAILPEARILCVADILEAVASPRPYRPALGVDKALAILQDGRGTQFDQAAVDAVVALAGEGALAFVGER
jgi:PAS domain S-box-containing protein